MPRSAQAFYSLASRFLKICDFLSEQAFISSLKLYHCHLKIPFLESFGKQAPTDFNLLENLQNFHPNTPFLEKNSEFCHPNIYLLATWYSLTQRPYTVLCFLYPMPLGSNASALHPYPFHMRMPPPPKVRICHGPDQIVGAPLVEMALAKDRPRCIPSSEMKQT